MDLFWITIGTVCTFLLSFRKWGWLDWYEARRPKWAPKGDCYLCLGFWSSIIVLLPAGYLVAWWLPFTAFPAAAFIATIMNLHHD